jgi:U3 small nucleolar RNA-associated protein 13
VLSVSSDGSMKSWELKTSSCLLTEECGNDKIWTLDASPDGGIVVTGSADSVLTLWHDVTEQKVSDAVEKKKKLVQDEQKLSNLMN